MMAILRELSDAGHTIIIVTHDHGVASHAERIIEISDGQIVSDRRNREGRVAAETKSLEPIVEKQGFAASLTRLADAFRMALSAMLAHRLRTALTMLGIVIGIASVISILAVIGGAQKSILSGVASLGADTINVLPGDRIGDEKAAVIQSLKPEDVEAISRLTYVKGASPTIVAPRLLRVGALSANGSVIGVGEQYFQVQNIKLARGRALNSADVASTAQVGVLDDHAATTLFGDQDPIGQTIFAGSVPIKVVGVSAKSEGLAAIVQSQNLQIWAPYTAVMARLAKQPNVSQITVQLVDGAPAAAAEKALVKTLIERHGKQDFFLLSTSTLREQLEKVRLVFSALFGSIGGISLAVGGIGVMNIMLVSVTERTREIGVRTAVGARREDILKQFIIEAVLVCLVGGAVGIGISMAIGGVFSLVVKSFELVFSIGSIAVAFGTATAIGLVFGWLPARRAAKLDPVEALARD